MQNNICVCITNGSAATANIAHKISDFKAKFGECWPRTRPPCTDRPKSGRLH